MNVAHLLGLDALFHVFAHLVLLAGEHVHDIPLVFGRRVVWMDVSHEVSDAEVRKCDHVDEDEVEERGKPPSRSMATMTTTVESVSSL